MGMGCNGGKYFNKYCYDVCRKGLSPDFVYVSYNLKWEKGKIKRKKGKNN